MTVEPDFEALARAYQPVLDELRATLDAEFGPLMWSPGSAPQIVTRHDLSRVVRVGAINAIGVPTPQLDPEAITAAVNKVLARHGFAEQPVMTGSPSGHLICEAVDSDGAQLTLLIKMAVDAWVDKLL